MNWTSIDFQIKQDLEYLKKKREKHPKENGASKNPHKTINLMNFVLDLQAIKMSTYFKYHETIYRLKRRAYIFG